MSVFRHYLSVATLEAKRQMYGNDIAFGRQGMELDINCSMSLLEDFFRVFLLMVQVFCSIYFMAMVPAALLTYGKGAWRGVDMLNEFALVDHGCC